MSQLEFFLSLDDLPHLLHFLLHHIDASLFVFAGNCMPPILLLRWHLSACKQKTLQPVSFFWFGVRDWWSKMILINLAGQSDSWELLRPSLRWPLVRLTDHAMGWLARWPQTDHWRGENNADGDVLSSVYSKSVSFVHTQRIDLQVYFELTLQTLIILW